MLPSRRLFALALGLQVLAGPAVAQQATIEVYHDKAIDATSHVRFRLPDENSGTWRDGPVPLLKVQSGGVVCFAIRNHNPLLYAYSANSTIVVPTSPSELSAFAEALTSLSEAKFGYQAAADGPNLTRYLNGIESVESTAQVLRRQRAESDPPDAPFERIAATVDSLVTVIINEAQNLDTAYAREQTKPVALNVLRAYWQRAAADARAERDAFRAARDVLDERYCVKVSDSNLRVVLSAKPRGPAPAQPARAVGDSLVAVDVEPIVTRRVAVGAGLLMSVGVGADRAFSVSNGVVSESEPSQPYFLPTLFAHFRAWNGDTIWGTMGVAGGPATKDEPDNLLRGFFLGVTMMFGEPAETSLALSTGLALTRVTTGIGGTSPGQPLPPDAESIDGLLETGLASGLGVAVTLTLGNE